MAKSLRSKRKRKMRAEKRKKNAPRELARLKSILGQEGKGEITMDDISEVANVVPAEQLNEKTADIDMEGGGDNMGKMETVSKSHKKNMLNQHGQYPKWMNHRQIKKMKIKNNPKKARKTKSQKNLAW
ncbi:protein LLP homolog [Denticeps clupeoides]|uniref:Protein LLP homolog n=1 Tax=Denticeps clupeoides TaxID=299321 RepID=A0AAY4DS28_9TELE|nr:protein LLP homolog [Denticeps clupeoides]XP_028811435.1 protein LLP homolog [Denticeps clupeoides]